MSRPLIRIPYTGAFPPPLIIPPSAASLSGAVAALAQFLTSSPPPSQFPLPVSRPRDGKTVLLTGAGLSVASGLADYRGEHGTYTQNKSYRPIYFHEFAGSHAARRRYWARSFLGWRDMRRSAPNGGHTAVAALARLGLVAGVVTQNVDSLHARAHPALPAVELHGFLRSLVCLSCRRLTPRDAFQAELARLNPRWAELLAELHASGALDTEDPQERARRGLRMNPDGDAEVPGMSYATFRYPACKSCLARPPVRPDGTKAWVRVDADGAWVEGDAGNNGSGGSGGSAGETVAPGVLKPNVVMFGESIPAAVKAEAEAMVDGAARLLVVGSSLATYSAWRLVKRASDAGMDIGILNVGGVRKEEAFLAAPAAGAGVLTDNGPPDRRGHLVVRVSLKAEEVLPAVVRALQGE